MYAPQAVLLWVPVIELLSLYGCCCAGATAQLGCLAAEPRREPAAVAAGRGGGRAAANPEPEALPGRAGAHAARRGPLQRRPRCWHAPLPHLLLLKPKHVAYAVVGTSSLTLGRLEAPGLTCLLESQQSM